MSMDIYTLVKLCLSGNEAAWKEMVDRYSGLVLSAALDVGLDYDLATDALQETFLELHRSIGRIADPGAMSRWLVVTTRRLSYRLATKQGVLLNESAADLVDERALPDEKLEALERQALARRALDRLKPECQALLGMLFLEEGSASYKEVSKRLGLAIGSIGSARARCLQSLKAVMKELD